MASFFMLDTAGDEQLFGENADKQPKTLYLSAGRDNVLIEDNDDREDEEDAEPVEMELFGIKLNSKDMSKAISNATKESGKPTKVAMQLDEVTEKVNEAAQYAGSHKLQKRQRIRDLHNSDPTEGLNIHKTNVEKNMEKTKLTAGFEQLNAIPTVARRKQPILNRAERAKTKGSGWFDLPATEITDEMRNELKIIQMRSVLDPKHFYKKNDLKVLPKYFQIGTVQHSPLDYYSEKHSRKTKKSLVDELLQDEAFQKFNKRKYNEVIQRTDKYAHRKTMKKMKKLKKRK
ncbi:CG1142 [Drosophila busckii]|uniref:CG1142 n=1 Tax=Drosophila busckii TaxID=30019 RepID=A0A0M4ET74_DROBS|nr:deoxynucleotidyltransferase terminal-interacting protein 2 [Drosophila busckii]ALC40407.1 CG1142 [Drosophila busckii]